MQRTITIRSVSYDNVEGCCQIGVRYNATTGIDNYIFATYLLILQMEANYGHCLQPGRHAFLFEKTLQ